MFVAMPALRLLLALLLVFSQQQAVLHLLGHDLSQLSQKQDTTDPKDAVCAKCLAIAHLDHALGGDGPVAIVPRVAPDAPSAFVTATVDLPFHARYRSRAPPSFS